MIPSFCLNISLLTIVKRTFVYQTFQTEGENGLDFFNRVSSNSINGSN